MVPTAHAVTLLMRNVIWHGHGGYRMQDIPDLLEGMRRTPVILSEFVKVIPEGIMDFRRAKASGQLRNMSAIWRKYNLCC